MTSATNKSANEAKTGITDMLHEASDRVGEFKDESMRTLGKSVDALAKAMKHHPLLAIGISLGAGYLIARIIHRG